MKKFNRFLLNLSALLCLSIILSSSFCSDDRPPIESLNYQTGDFPIVSIRLAYNLSYEYLDSLQMNGYPSVLSDFQELHSFHPGIYMTNGTITRFRDILSENMDYSGCEIGPSIKFDFSITDYKGSISKQYTSYDSHLCELNIIQEAPLFQSEHLVDYSIHTIKATNGMQLIWKGIMYLDGYTQPEVVTSMQLIADAITKSGVGNSSGGGSSNGGNPRQDIAIGDDQILDPVNDNDNSSATFDDGSIIENTISGDLPGGEYFVVPSDSSIVFSPILLQKVYSGGSFRDDICWSIPRRAILEPVEDGGGSAVEEPINSIGKINLE